MKKHEKGVSTVVAHILLILITIILTISLWISFGGYLNSISSKPIMLMATQENSSALLITSGSIYTPFKVELIYNGTNILDNIEIGKLNSTNIINGSIDGKSFQMIIFDKNNDHKLDAGDTIYFKNISLADLRGGELLIIYNNSVVLIYKNTA